MSLYYSTIIRERCFIFIVYKPILQEFNCLTADIKSSMEDDKLVFRNSTQETNEEVRQKYTTTQNDLF